MKLSKVYQEEVINKSQASYRNLLRFVLGLEDFEDTKVKYLYYKGQQFLFKYNSNCYLDIRDIELIEKTGSKKYLLFKIYMNTGEVHYSYKSFAIKIEKEFNKLKQK